MSDLKDDSNVFPNDGIFNEAYDDEDVGAEADFNNMDNTIDVSHIPTLRVHKDYPKGQILGDPKSGSSNKRKDPKGFFSTTSFEEPKMISQALEDENWVEAIQEELLKIKLHKVWILVDFPFGKKAIGIKWVLRNKRDERSIVVKNKSKAFRLFLAFTSFMRFLVYKMDVKSAFLYGTIKEELLELGMRHFLLYCWKMALGESMRTEFEDCMHKRFQMSSMADILKKFDFCSIKIATTPIVSNKPLVKDKDCVNVDVHIYRSMIGSLMYLTASRTDIMFVVCACTRFQVTPKASHLNAVKSIFRRLISWQCKKQTIMANSTTKAEYVLAANCCGQLVWIQNQMMDYGFNFMNTKIHIDNESAICIVKNHVYHSRTKHIKIRHHFIRDYYEKRLIDVIKIHTDANVVDLLTKGFDVIRFNFLVANLVLPGKFDAARQIWCYQANLVLPGKFGAARQTFVLLVTDTTVGERNRFSLIKYNLSMANLEFVNQYSMVACLEKTEGNFDFHEIVDFLASSLIHHALTINAIVDSKLGEPFNDVYPTPAYNLKVYTNMFRKELKFSGKITPLFPNMLTHAAEGKGSVEPTKPQPIPSVTQPSTRDQTPKTSPSDATTQDSRDSLEETNRNEGDQVQTPHDSPILGGHASDRAKGALNLQELSVLCTNLSNRVLALESIKDAQAAEISALKIRIKRLEKKCKPSISHHIA
ncbi:hypothetical protein Tco_1361616 [Tanacetum coccineum]